jgi:hypothetical protein
MNIQSDKWQVAGGKRPKVGASLAPRHLPLATLILWGVVLVARADVLIGTNGDRFTGKVVEETAESVVFDAELGGRLTIPRTRIREIQRPVPPLTDNRSRMTNGTPASVTNQLLAAPKPGEGGSSSLSWLPPAIGHDKEDWIQLKSGEWLRGRLYYIQQRKVEFASDELDDFSLDLKDVRQV